MKNINIGLLGCGTVGTGVARILLDGKDLIASRLGATLTLRRVADVDTVRDRGIGFAPGVFTDDARSVVDDPDIDIVVEMIGGQTAAKELMLKAIENGKQVVTANKALLASQGNTIFRAAAERRVDLAFEASVGGGMPIIKTLRESLAANRIRAMIGILNGTCNYILSKITDDGSPFAAALAEAQAKGYAEANPALDVEGHDTAHKIAILSALAYGMDINLAEVYTEGIAHITPMDIQFADQFGYRIKLLAISKFSGEAVEARVHPTMISFDNMLSNVNGTLNAITVSADQVDDILLCGRGAGMRPTASAVVADLVDISRNLLSGAAGRVPLLSFQMDAIRKRAVLPISDIVTHYYLRFSALDRPGVLSRISGILGACGISIKSAYQKGRKIDGSVPLVMLTHAAKEADVTKALTDIAALDVVSDRPVLIRIEDERNGE
jgi:homoserine dehydrogenase